MPHAARRSILIPKLFTTLEGYDRHRLARDLTAGVIVGVVALPLAIAFAIASGVTPDRGLWTAIVAGFLISALGGSRVQIGGPTGAFVVIVYGIVQKHGIDGLMIATLMAGVMLVLMGVAKLGSAIRFIPHSVITGFTSGIAVLIGLPQLADALGHAGPSPESFVAKIAVLPAYVRGANPYAVAVAFGTMAILLFWPRLTRKVPAPFVGLILATLAVGVLRLPVETIGARFGAVSSSIPTPSLPAGVFQRMPQLFLPALSIALLGAIESLLSATVADRMTGAQHRWNMELVAQGVANLATPLFGGIPATGAIARTATNVKNGGTTPVAGITHAITLLLLTLVFGGLASRIPFACLAAILLLVAYHMSEWREFVAALRRSRGDAIVLLSTFLLTILVNLIVGIAVGIVLAAVLVRLRSDPDLLDAVPVTVVPSAGVPQ
jgi:SulP family sulfate permease